MFKLLTRAKTIPTDLLTSRLHDEESFYRAFIQDIRSSEREVIIESPFMTRARLDCLIPHFNRLLKRGVKITINTRHPKDIDGYMREQTWETIKTLNKMKIRVNLYRGMHHRKLAVIDERIVWEGSLNILSQVYSSEIMRRIESPQMAVQLLCFIDMKRRF
jgi:phosphatidylserine/phosphatidylglycerophosphate/cardiolipin synthase-like enzyme